MSLIHPRWVKIINITLISNILTTYLEYLLSVTFGKLDFKKKKKSLYFGEDFFF